MRKLRGHHLLCVHGFQGMGYSPAFVKKMEEIVREIRDHFLDFPIQVLIDLDEACSACPHKGEDFCNAKAGSDEHVKGMDGKVLHHLGLTPGHSYLKSDLIKRVKERVHPEDLDT
ncbi:MAG: DUF1284 domain-containing protein, partial [Thermicanus sp.]|nr:DUF1284 domain-containing protein [Thermicanus sp.]